jgi:hypothetical protein
MAVFRPSARVRLQLRIDELTDTGSLGAGLKLNPPTGASVTGTALPTTQSGAQAGLERNQQQRQVLTQSRASMAVEDFNRERSRLDQERDALQKVRQSTETQSVPAVVDPAKGTQDGLTVIFDVLPLQCTVERNALKDADTARVQLDFRDVPVDPRIVRACFISISIGVVSVDDYAAGMAGQRRADGSLRSLVVREPGEELRLDSSTRFTGFVDSWEVVYGEDGDTIELNCRDVSAVLRDQKLHGRGGNAKTVDLKKPVSEGLQEVIDQFVSTRGIQVKTGTPVDASRPLDVLTPEFDPTPVLAMPKTAKKRKGKQAVARVKANNQSLWDHLTDVTLRLGLVPVLRGFTLFLLEPRVVFRDLTSARRMVWGRNIKQLRFTRKMGGVKADTIEVRSPDPTIGRTRWARFPVLNGEARSGVLGLKGSPQPVTSRPNNVASNGLADESVRVMSIPAVSDLATLERIAENVFNEIGRQEIEGELETDDIASFESAEEADLLRLLPGEPITVLVAPPVETDATERAALAAKPVRSTSNLQELQAQSVAKRVDYLARLGVSGDTAQRLAIAQEKIRLISTFRVAKVAIEWSADDGVSVSVPFYNFVVVREAPEDENGQVEPSASLTEAAGRAL